MDNHRKEKTKACIAIGVIALVVIISILTMIRYQVEGEKNMPFNLSKIIVISSAEGVQKNEESQAKWDLSIIQNNDIYFEIEKNDNYKSDNFIKSIKFDHFNVITPPAKGTIQMYMPNSLEGRLFTYSDEFVIENTLTFKGASKTDAKNLQIGNQGGTVLLRIANTNIGEYISQEDDEIKHDGTLIQKTETTKEEIAFCVSFNMLIETKSATYKTNLVLDLPCKENVIEEGTCQLEIPNVENLVFKRVTN